MAETEDAEGLMTEETKNGIGFDRSYWPKQKPAATVEIKFADLWENYADEMQVEMAEALIDDPPQFGVTLEDHGAQMECFLWNVGGDVLVIYRDLSKFIDDIVDRAPDQVDGMKLGYLAIKVLQEKLAKAKKALDSMNKKAKR